VEVTAGASHTVSNGSIAWSGYTFAGWNTQANGEGTSYMAGDSFTVNSHVTLYAQWSKVADTYTVTYDANEGTGSVPDSETVEAGKNHTVLSGGGLSRTGYTFAGWNTQAKGGGTSYMAGNSFPVNSNVTLYAQWTATIYPITYTPNSGTGTLTPTSYTIESGTITLPILTRDGYTFGGWYESSGFTGTAVATIPAGSTGGKTYYAQWTANTYTVTYHANTPAGASGTVSGSMADSTHTYDTAKPLTANGYQLTGWTFTGWNTQPDGGGMNYSDRQSVTNLTAERGGSVPLYAQWHKDSGIAISFGGGPQAETIDWSTDPAAAISWGDNESLSATVDTSAKQWANGASFAWYVDGVRIVGTDSSITISAQNYALGTHILAVDVTKDAGSGAESYSKTVKFTVVR
jgi:uncharacterized repeat protein (TIGR02543 family)